MFGEHVGSSLEGRRPVDQVKVEVVEAECVERQIEGHFNVVGMVEGVPELAGHEDLLALDVQLLHGLLQTLPDLGLVLVDEGAVDVTVAGLQGVLHRHRNLEYVWFIFSTFDGSIFDKTTLLVDQEEVPQNIHEPLPSHVLLMKNLKKNVECYLAGLWFPGSQSQDGEIVSAGQLDVLNHFDRSETNCIWLKLVKTMSTKCRSIFGYLISMPDDFPYLLYYLPFDYNKSLLYLNK